MHHKLQINNIIINKITKNNTQLGKELLYFISNIAYIYTVYITY